MTLFRIKLIVCMGLILFSCSQIPKSHIKGGEFAHLWDGVVQHPWHGEWVAIWTGSLFRALSLDAPVFTIQDDGSFELRYPNVVEQTMYRDIYICLEDRGNDTFLYQRIKSPRTGVIKKQEYAKFKIFRVSDDHEMLCDQIWRGEFAPTVELAIVKEINTPFASRESMAKFWTESKLEGMHVIYAGFKKLFLKCRQAVSYFKEKRASSSDQVDGFYVEGGDELGLCDDDFDQLLDEIDSKYENTRL